MYSMPGTPRVGPGSASCSKVTDDLLMLCPPMGLCLKGHGNEADFLGFLQK